MTEPQPSPPVTVCECGGSTTILYSRPFAGNKLRRRQCSKCGQRWSTVEVRKETK